MPKDSDNVMTKEQDTMEKWDYNDQVTQYLLLQQLPDSTAVHMEPYTTVKVCWDQVSTEFTVKSVYMQNDLESAFNEMKCQKGDDVSAFLTSLDPVQCLISLCTLPCTTSSPHLRQRGCTQQHFYLVRISKQTK